MDLLFFIEHSLLGRQLLLGQAFSEKVSKFILFIYFNWSVLYCKKTNCLQLKWLTPVFSPLTHA